MAGSVPRGGKGKCKGPEVGVCLDSHCDWGRGGGDGEREVRKVVGVK